MTEQHKTEKASVSGWTVDDKKKIACLVFPLLELQKLYGKKIDPKLCMQGWQAKFEHRFTAEQIYYAVDKYSDERDDFPSPANIVAILEPVIPEITATEYLAAKKVWENRGLPMHCEQRDTVKAYEEQTITKREKFKIENEEILKVSQSAGKAAAQAAAAELQKDNFVSAPVARPVQQAAPVQAATGGSEF